MKPLAKPLLGVWRAHHFPKKVMVRGRVFELAEYSWPAPGVIAQYREAVKNNSRHLKVYANGTFRIDHIDEVNPDKEGRIVEHLMVDLVKR